MATHSEASAELRTDCPREVLDVLDAVSMAHGLTRGQLVVQVLKKWADEKHREASLVAKITRFNPARSE